MAAAIATWLLLTAMLTLTATAATVPFTIDLTWGPGSPNGHTRNMIHVNGSSPGPTLYMSQGDTVEFKVINSLPFNTSVHFHGITQLGTPWSDGVPGLSQIPIAPGKAFMYRWTADEYGTFFYHAHEKGQIMDGLQGAIYIQPPQSQPRPFNMLTKNKADIAAILQAEKNPNIVLIGDWNDYTSSQFFESSRKADIDTYCTNSILINGRGQVDCLGVAEYESIALPITLSLLNGTNITDQGCAPPIPIAQGDNPTNASKLLPGIMFGCNATTNPGPVFNVSKGQKWASFNFISAAAVTAPVVSIDEHQMWVYAVDGHYITPQLVNGITIGNGERYSAMVALSQEPADYTLRVSNYGFNQIISGFAKVSYKGGNTSYSSKPYFSYSGQNLTASVTQLDTSKLVPYPAVKPAPTADSTFLFNLGRTRTAYNWAMNESVAFPLDFQSPHPMLYFPNSSVAQGSAYAIRTRNNTWVDIVLQVTPDAKAPLQPPHPIHKHSNKGFIIGTGNGPFNYSSTAEAIKAVPQFFNLDTPAYRDTFTTPPPTDKPTWIVVRYQVINPGAWLMHCHIQPHVQGGMAMAILDGVDAFPTIPSEYELGRGGF